MNDIRRTILWVVFGFSMILLWDQWQIHNGQKATFFPAPVASKPLNASSAAIVSAVPSSASAAPAAVGVNTPASVAAVPGAPAVPNEKIIVSTDVLKLTFETLGGSLVRAELLQHPDNAAGVKGTSGPVVLFDNSPERAYAAQTGMIPAVGASNVLPTHQTAMVFSGDRAMNTGADVMTLRFESVNAGDVRLLKTYTVRRTDYVIDVKHEITNLSANPLTAQLYMQLVRDGNKPVGEVSSSMFTGPASTFTGPAVYTAEKKFQKAEFTDIEKNKAEHIKTANDGYVAMVQHYFATAWMLPDGQTREMFTKKVNTNLYAVGMITPITALANNQTKTVDARLFVGPQEEKKLEQLTPGLELVKDYGWLTILAKPLYWLLDVIHSLLGNWGWAIVGLVVLLKAAFYGLNASAYRSMAKMKGVNPRVMELRERLKDKPQEMQQAMMKLYKDEKVNPMGGCFPILIQIPVFIALYTVLLSTVEMRNAPWILWIKDLAAPDPWFLLPLLMTGTTMLQTWLNPTPPDPLQAKLMWIMPLVFSVMFFFFPAGLVMYWITNNVLSIAQQWFINKRLGVLGK